MKPNWIYWNLLVKGPSRADTLLPKGEIMDYGVEDGNITFISTHGEFIFRPNSAITRAHPTYFLADDGSTAVLLPPSNE